MPATGLEVPVVFLVFNRPELTARVFDRIKEARPRKLFVVADGPRPGRTEDAEKCRRVRELIETGVDWPCELVRDYAATNLGCGRRVASGITSAFERVEEAIILEDDCLPDPSFFRYCAELLERYRYEPKVGLVSGSHHQIAPMPGEASYYFCRYGNIWGWATWRRAWQKFDYTMSDWPQWRDAGGIERLFSQREVQAFWRKTWNRTAADKNDTWDYQWTYGYMHHGLLGILPRVALIENIGFGAGATHTIAGGHAPPRVEPMVFPLRHPASVEPDLDAEACASRRFFFQPPIWKRVLTRLAHLRIRLFRRG